MKSFIILCLCGFAALAVARPESTYTDKYDKINLDEILSNERLLKSYIKCCLDEAKCTNEGKELKSHLVEAMTNNCAKCTKVQQNGSRKVLAHIITNLPEYWNRLKAKYDPEAKYTPAYEKELRESQG